MSLLMDALRKAEESKKNSEQTEETPSSEGSGAAVDVEPTKSTREPSLDIPLEFDAEETPSISPGEEDTALLSEEAEPASQSQSALERIEKPRESAEEEDLALKLDNRIEFESDRIDNTESERAMDSELKSLQEIVSPVDENDFDLDLSLLEDPEKKSDKLNIQPDAESPAEQIASIAEEPAQEVPPTHSAVQDRAQSVFLAKRQSSLKTPLTILGIVIILLGGGFAYLQFYGLEPTTPLVNIPSTATQSTPQAAESPINTVPIAEPEPIEDLAAAADQLAAVETEASPASEPGPDPIIPAEISSASAAVETSPVVELPETEPQGVADAPIQESTIALTIADEPAVSPPAEVAGLSEPEIPELVESEIPEPVNERELAAERAGGEAPIELISFTRRNVQRSIIPEVEEAYSAYQAGQFAQAQLLYEAVLREERNQRDALLGLAALAIRQDDPYRAMEYYSRLLARNPADPVARAGLLDLRLGGSNEQREAELRQLISRHPDVATLHFTLGNFYSLLGRWAEAQVAYFDALQIAKLNSGSIVVVHPDYAFNLAVSLEHLGQAGPALSFYREALLHAGSMPTGFSIDALQRRIATLETLVE